MSKAPILITGGAGFIGSHLVDALLAKGQAVRVLDNFSTGKLDNLGLPRAGLELIQGDVADAQVVAESIQGCQAVVHLAAVASVQASVEDPLGTHQSNLIGTLNLCEAMRSAGVRRILFASSAAVYGNHSIGPVPEDAPKAPLTPYAVDKLASEFYLEFYQRQHQFEPIIFRLFNIYGPRQDPSSPYSGVISIFMDRVRKRQPIQVFGDGEQTRDFLYVGDLIQLFSKSLDCSVPVQGAVNVGLNQATTLNQLLQAIGSLQGGLPEVAYLPPRAGDIRCSRADTTKLLQSYGLPQITEIQEGLARTLAFSSV